MSGAVITVLYSLQKTFPCVILLNLYNSLGKWTEEWTG